MMRRLPIIPTLLVLAAVAVMVRLGFWQIDRKHEKDMLLARYAQAQAMSSEAPWPRSKQEAQNAYYRHATIRCAGVDSIVPMAGINAKGESGLAHVAACELSEGGGRAQVVLGWSRDPGSRRWRGGEVSGIVTPGGEAGPRLVANPPLAGLEPSARPDPSTIPNNHLSYAVQWFLFAAVALAIYALALRKRIAGPGGDS